MIAFFYIALVLLAVIFFQDLRSRAIWWFLPPVLFACFIALRWNAATTLTEIALNTAFITALIGFLVIYIRFRFGKLENPFKNYFGLGDFLFLIALTPLFPFREFVYFFTFGTLAVLVVHGAVYLFKKTSTIPYAGYLALFTGCYLVANQFFPLVINALTDLNG